MKRIVYFGIIGMLLSIGGLRAEAETIFAKKQKNDTASYTVVSAKIIEEDTKNPVVFATVYKTGTSIGTVSNSDGEFELKIPGKSTDGTLSITHLGYKTKEVFIKDIVSGKAEIILKQHAIPIEEVVIKDIDPAELLKKALLKKNKNYNQSPEMQTAFYRETLKQRRNYVSISEAVLDIYNSGYKENFDFDRVRIYKGRKSKDVKKMDTVLVKFQGGPRTAMFLDIVKNPGVILDPELFTYYDYELAGIVSIDNRNNYVIRFTQKNKVDYPLYDGKIYLDVESLAITSLDFQLSEMSLDDATRVLVKKKPLTMKIDVLSGNYLVKYREIDGKWVLNYVRSEVSFKTKWDKKLFKTNIVAMFEMAVTDRDTQNIEKFPYKVAVKFTDILSEKVQSFQDIDFWGEYNTIKPDESIEVAIEKLNKKLMRND
ncbi:MAG: carboxypeptidase-like regulatory domain-containing protein [Bacteroidales bacterium]|jgi:hypothetical protein